jgi:ubiquinone/menaquinone biosynthesis C-methylase UbiE
MASTDHVFTGSIAEIYERDFVPLLFQPYARDLAARVAKLAPRDVLETAAGTGVVTRALVGELSPTTRIVATDLNPGMLTQAAARLPGGARLEWQQADALALPFDDRSFDVVVCQFGVMFFPDKEQGYREARRVLRPGGHFVFNTWGRIEESEFEDVVTNALALVFSEDPPRFLARTPHGYHDLERIHGELTRAGFTSIASETLTETSPAPSARAAAVALCQGSPLRSEIEARDPARLDEATERATEALAKRFGNGPIAGRMQAHVLTASA